MGKFVTDEEAAMMTPLELSTRLSEYFKDLQNLGVPPLDAGMMLASVGSLYVALAEFRKNH